MICLRLNPGEKTLPLTFFLSMEEWAASHLCDVVPVGEKGEVFFLWQSPPTVIFGRNQVMEAEVNIPYCRENGIDLCRRKSGGGCVYSDRGNVMLSLVTSDPEVRTAFSSFMDMEVSFLHSLGLEAYRSGRNDVIVGGRKVSGNALLRTPKANIVHGTLLFDSDFSRMEKAITPHGEKVSSKGVDSVRARVGNIRQMLLEKGTEMDVEGLKERIWEFFRGDSEDVWLSDAQVEEILCIEKTYRDPSFLSGKKHSFTIHRESHLEGVGQVEVDMDMAGEGISSLRLGGDFMTLSEGVEDLLNNRLHGRPDDRAAAEKALEGLVMEKYVLNLTSKAFLDIAFGKGEEDT